MSADGAASVLAHELEEAVTDPDLNAWYSNYDGAENADKATRAGCRLRSPRDVWAVSLRKSHIITHAIVSLFFWEFTIFPMKTVSRRALYRLLFACPTGGTGTFFQKRNRAGLRTLHLLRRLGSTQLFKKNRATRPPGGFEDVALPQRFAVAFLPVLQRLPSARAHAAARLVPAFPISDSSNRCPLRDGSVRHSIDRHGCAADRTGCRRRTGLPGGDGV